MPYTQEKKLGTRQKISGNSGFTLVELSIVLVILGLLVGGILAGSSLVKAASMRAIMTQYDTFTTAKHTFRDKYFSLPGDMTNATSFWGKDNTYCTGHTGTAATPGTCNGNGDGIMDFPGSANATGEVFRYWQHLALAGLISGTFTGNSASASNSHSIAGQNVPASKLNGTGWSIYHYGTITVNGGGTGNFEGTYGNTFVFGLATSNGIYELPAMRPDDTWNIDTKMDDGKPGTGILRVFESYANCHDATPSTTVAIATTANYRLAYDGIACVLVFNL